MKLRFSKESNMLDDFRAWAQKAGYTIHPEVDTWDLVLVKDGIQYGIQGKLAGNMKVLSQCLGRGPVYRAVVVDRCSPDFKEVSRALGVPVFIKLHTSWWQEGAFKPFTGGKDLKLHELDTSFLKAGEASPRALTEWRLRSIKLAGRLRQQGFITTKDFKEFKVSPTFWIKKFVDSSGKEGRMTKYIARPGVKLPDVGWDEIVEQLKEQK